jgi:hypothetical protein
VLLKTDIFFIPTFLHSQGQPSWSSLSNALFPDDPSEAHGEIRLHTGPERLTTRHDLLGLRAGWKPMVQGYQIEAYRAPSTKIGCHFMMFNKLIYKTLALRPAPERHTLKLRLDAGGCDLAFSTEYRSGAKLKRPWGRLGNNKRTANLPR